jgi:hypothetical protein
MNTKEDFKLKMEEEIAHAQAVLERFTALGMGFTATAKNNHDELVEQLEQKLDGAKAQLRVLGEAEGQTWEEVKDGMSSTWEAVKSALQDANEKFKTTPPVAGLHGNDNGAYPYGDGLSGRSNKKEHKLRKGE